MVPWLLGLFLFVTQIIHALFNLINFLNKAHDAFVSLLDFFFQFENLSLFRNLWLRMIIRELADSCGVTNTLNSTAIDLWARKVGAESAHVIVAELLLRGSLDRSWKVCCGVVCIPLEENYLIGSLSAVNPIHHFFFLTLVNVIVALVLFFRFLNLWLDFLYHLKSVSLHFALWSIRSFLIGIDVWVDSLFDMLDHLLDIVILALVIRTYIENGRVTFWRIYRSSQYSLRDFLRLARDLLLTPAVGYGKLLGALVLIRLSGKVVVVVQDFFFQIKSVHELIRVFNRRTRLGLTFLEIIKATIDKLNLVLV